MVFWPGCLKGGRLARRWLRLSGRVLDIPDRVM